MTIAAYRVKIARKKAIDVVEAGGRSRKGRIAFDLGRDLKFSTAALESYAFARWEPVIYDAMVVAAAIEYADRTIKRPTRGRARKITLRIPVHEPTRWADPHVSDLLHDVARFLTGDFWTIDFALWIGATPAPPQEYLQLTVKTEAVIAFSDGIVDSRAVAGIAAISLGNRLVRVRVGPKAGGRPRKGGGAREPFAAVPYEVAAAGETSNRSSGFKFALISGIAAYLQRKTREILIPESGQGVFGPALATVGHGYADYRNHPNHDPNGAVFVCPPTKTGALRI